jgi:hypothetical protein
VSKGLTRRQARQMRAFAVKDACSLAVELGQGAPARAPAVHDIGVVLDTGEMVWRQVVARWETVTVTGYVQHRQTLFGGMRSWQVERSAWSDMGVGTWWLTNHRIVGRTWQGQLLGWRWENLVGCVVDLPGERVTFDVNTGHRFALTGPATPVVAVAAIAHLHGVAALLTHPALGPLRLRRDAEPAWLAQAMHELSR